MSHILLGEKLLSKFHTKGKWIKTLTPESPKLHIFSITKGVSKEAVKTLNICELLTGHSLKA